MLVDGKWQTRARRTEGGRFVRPAATFRSFIRADGSSPHAPESGRYHLYVSLACPWAHRALIVRALKGLAPHVGLSVVDPLMLEEGWVFSDGPGCIPDGVLGARRLYEVYQRAQPDFSGRVTVPVLWDGKLGTIVNNESSEIIRMFTRELDALTGVNAVDLYPEALRPAIDAINDVVYANVNNGVYRCGFAAAQDAYEEAFDDLFGTLDDLEQRLARQRFLVGSRFTEADVRLFTTLVRFDAVYVGHFKCNLRRIADYPQLSAYLRELYQLPHFAETVSFDHIKRHYYMSHLSINPKQLVPKGPELALDRPHDRARLPADPIPELGIGAGA
jgi:putative glutathione S-transferase